MATPHLSTHPAPPAPEPDAALLADARDWPRLVALAASIVGVAIAIYLSVVHLTTAVPLYCSATGVVNCEQVVTSPASMVFGIPVAYYGVAWFVVMALVLVRPAGPLLSAGRLAWAVVGALTVLYLFYTELFVIGAICLWCSIVHALVLVIFASQVLFPRMAPEDEEAV